MCITTFRREIGSSRLQRSGEGTALSLLIPPRDPFVGAKRVVGTLELLAGRKIVTLGGDAFEVVGIVLEAMTRLVGIGEAGVKPGGLEDVLARKFSLRHVEKKSL